MGSNERDDRLKMHKSKSQLFSKCQKHMIENKTIRLPREGKSVFTATDEVEQINSKKIKRQKVKKQKTKTD